jgi:2-polyprenyl-3-methyl-5-hydroxy-6-metoxy-1,4-benzoquinol methylase
MVQEVKYWDDYYTTDPKLDEVDLSAYSLKQVKDLLKFSKKLLAEHRIKGRVLDIGGGSGKVARFYQLNDRNEDVHVIDLSSAAIEIAMSKGHPAQVLDIQNSALPYPNDYFDVVLLQEVIEHLQKPDFVLSEIQRVLKNGGVLFLTTPNLTSLADRIFLLFGKLPFILRVDRSHINLCTFATLEQQLLEKGLKPSVSRTQGVYLPLFKGKYIRMNYLRSIFKRLGQHIVLIAEKS